MNDAEHEIPHHRQRILIVDDDLDNQMFVQLALEKVLSEQSTLNFAGSGNEAIAYMMGEGKFVDRSKFPFPSCIITDLNMVDGDGFDVLEFMQANKGWNVVPRILFSSSARDDDVRTAFVLGASAYHVKPLQPENLKILMRRLIEYWSTSLVSPVDESGKQLSTHSDVHLGVRFPQTIPRGVMERPKKMSAADQKKAQA